jgi:hypothetical protein
MLLARAVGRARRKPENLSLPCELYTLPDPREGRARGGPAGRVRRVRMATQGARAQQSLTEVCDMLCDMLCARRA